MSRSINPMYGLFAPGRSNFPLRPLPHRLDESAPAIPWRGALQHCPPPLHRLFSMLYPTAENSQELSEHVRGTFDPHQKNSCRKPGPRGTTIYVPGLGPLAGFEVIMSGRI